MRSSKRDGSGPGVGCFRVKNNSGCRDLILACINLTLRVPDQVRLQVFLQRGRIPRHLTTIRLVPDSDMLRSRQVLVLAVVHLAVRVLLEVRRQISAKRCSIPGDFALLHLVPDRHMAGARDAGSILAVIARDCSGRRSGSHDSVNLSADVGGYRGRNRPDTRGHRVDCGDDRRRNGRCIRDGGEVHARPGMLARLHSLPRSDGGERRR